MANNKLSNDLVFPKKYLETGYSEQQPKWPYWVSPHHYQLTEWEDIHVWLNETFGESNWGEWNSRWVGSMYKFYFRDEADRTFFILRWT